MSKLSNNLKGYNARTHIPLNEPWGNHFQVDTQVTPIAPEYGYGVEYRVSVVGITDIQANPDFIPMMKESRARGIVPNFTMSGIDLTPEIADEIAPLIGACAVSVYQRDKNIAYNAIKMMLDRGVNQTNIHLFVSSETIDFVYEVLNDVRTDERLTNLNAVVFLGVKPKGRAKGHFHSLNQGEFSQLIKFCMTYNIPHGFDSCSAPKYVQAVVNMDLTDSQKESMLQAAEKWATTFTITPEADGETVRQHCKETTLRQFCREVYGEFEPLLFELESEVGRYMNNRKMMELIHEMRRRMNE
jgi:hypothetical protein